MVKYSTNLSMLSSTTITRKPLHRRPHYKRQRGIASRFQACTCSRAGSCAGYECELPASARAELVGLRRPPIPPPSLDRPLPVRPTRERVLTTWRSIRGLVFIGAAGLGLVVLLAAGLASLSRKSTILAPAPDLVLEHSKAILAAEPTPGWRADGTAYGRAGVLPEVRRAERLSPAPRAEQVFRIGKWNPVWMPDGALTWVRFWGVKDTFADLPRSPQLGDSYGVLEGGQHALWIWSIPRGFTRAAWVDP
jgi:hypothetical protein